MAGEWKSVPVEVVADSISDTHPRTKDRLVFLNTSDVLLGKILHRMYSAVSEWPGQAKKSIHRDDILFSEIRPANGRWAFVDFDAEDFVVSTKLMVIRPRPDRVMPRFLYHFLTCSQTTRWLQHLAESRSGTFPQITFDQVAELEICLPPLVIQTAIAGFLDRIDNKIELNRRMSETLEAMARALFKSWFVDFEPVRAKAEGRDPGLPKPIADLFPARLVDSELGEIPEGWELGSFYKIADVIYGAPFSSAQFNTEGKGEPLIRIRDLSAESPGVWTLEVHPRGYRVQDGDILVGMDGEFRAYLWGGIEAWLNQRICVFKPKRGWSPAFVYNALIQPLAHVEATETATTVIHLGKADINLFKVVLPGPVVSDMFNKLCQPWYDRIVKGKQESRTLAALRDTLLPKLISGELRIKDAEKFLGRAGI